MQILEVSHSFWISLKKIWRIQNLISIKLKYSGCVSQVQFFLTLGIKMSLIIIWDLERGEMGCQMKIITSIVIFFKKFIIHKLQWHRWNTQQWNKIFLACNIAHRRWPSRSSRGKERYCKARKTISLKYGPLISTKILCYLYYLIP